MALKIFSNKRSVGSGENVRAISASVAGIVGWGVKNHMKVVNVGKNIPVFFGLKLFQYHKWRSYMLIVFTVIVCCIGYYTKIPAFALLFSYIVGFAILKSFVSIKLKDLFNMKSVKSIFKTIGSDPIYFIYFSFDNIWVLFYNGKY